MLGNGKAHIRTLVKIAQAQVEDGGEPPEAIQAFASLGAFGRCPANEERDLHTWLKDLHGISLEVYYVSMMIQAPQL